MILKLGDTAPALVIDTNANLTGITANSIRFYKLDGTLIFSRSGTVTDALTGVVQYQWVVPGDNSVIGTLGAYRIDVKVTFSGGAIETFPQPSMLELLVR
jgi:hypothetical protein